MGKPTLVVLVLTYLVFHAFSGNNGIYAYLREQHRLSAQEHELKELVQYREKMQKNVQHLSTQSLDLDLLDERARAVLGYAKSGEVIYLLPQEES